MPGTKYGVGDSVKGLTPFDRLGTGDCLTRTDSRFSSKDRPSGGGRKGCLKDRPADFD